MSKQYQTFDRMADGIRSIFTGANAATAKSSADGTSDATPAVDSESAEVTADQVVEYFGCGRFQLRILVASAVLTAADAMEMMLLAVLGPALRCDWQLSSGQVAMLTTFVFVGMFIGSPTWGTLSDKCGRKAVLTVSASLIVYFGLMCSVAPNYPWVVFLRAMIGFNIGGGIQCYTLLSEYLPQKSRVFAMVGNLVCWGVGGTLEILLAWAVLPRLGWRVLAALTALPVLLALPLFITLPDSLRYLLASGQNDEAVRVMQQMASENRRPPLKGRMVAGSTSDANRGHIVQLFHVSMRRTTLTLFPIWFGVAFTYYGLALLSADVSSFKQRCLFGDSRLSHTVDTSCCRRLDSRDFKNMLLSALGEFAMQPFNLILLDRLGRKPVLAGHFALASFFIGLVSVCMPDWGTTLLLFLARGSAAALFSCSFVYTTEVYPTSIRSLGVGVNSAVGRIGSMLTPLVAQVLLPEVSTQLAFAIYVCTAIVCCFLALSLPIETLGRALQQTVTSDTAAATADTPDSDGKTK